MFCPSPFPPAILAYVTSFVLIRYQLSDAEKTEQASKRPSTVSSKPDGHTRLQSFSAESTLSPWEAYTDLRALVSVYEVHFLSILSCSIVPCQAHAKRNRDPEKTAAAADDPGVKLKSMVTTLLETVMTQLGFVLALLGILAYFWTGLPRALGIIASALLGTCLLAIGAVIM